MELEFETPYVIDLDHGTHRRHFSNQQQPQNNMKLGGGGPTILVVLVPARHIPGSAMLVFPDTVVGSILVTGDFKYEVPAEVALTGAYPQNNQHQRLLSGKKRQRAEWLQRHQVVQDPMIDTIRFWLKELRPSGVIGEQPIPDGEEYEDYSLSSVDVGVDGDDGNTGDGRSETNTEDLLLQISGGNAGDGDHVPREESSVTLVSSSPPSPSKQPQPPAQQLPPHTTTTTGFSNSDNFQTAADKPAILDHLFFDDTWLHLHPDSSSFNPHRQTPKSKLLSSAQLVRAFQSLKAILWFQCRLGGDGSGKGKAGVGGANGGVGDSSAASSSSSVAPPAVVRPFVVRVYIHNNFGKEAILASLAAILGGTTVVVDEDRYAYLAALSHTGPDIGGGGVADNNHSNNLDDDNDSLPPPHTSSSAYMNSDFSIPNPDLFIPASQLASALSEWQHQQQRTTGTAAHSSSIPPGCIEVVGSRDAVSAGALFLASKNSIVEGEARDGGPMQTRYYGLIMTGWAKSTTRKYPTLGQHQSSPSSEHHTASNIFEVPYSLHTSPENLVSFVRALRPRSVSGQHPKECRSAMMSSLLGPHLYEPSHPLSTLEVRGDIPIPISWSKYVNGAPKRTDEQLYAPTTAATIEHHLTDVAGGNTDNSFTVGSGYVRTKVGRCWTHLSVPGNTTSATPQTQHQQHSPGYSHSSSPLGRLHQRNDDTFSQLKQITTRRVRVGTRAVTIQPPSSSPSRADMEPPVDAFAPDGGDRVDAAAVPFNLSMESNRTSCSTSATVHVNDGDQTLPSVSPIQPNTAGSTTIKDYDEDEALSNLLRTRSPSLWEMAENRW